MESGKKKGRPVKYPMPERIPDTPENVARAIMNTPPRKRDDWEFMKLRKGVKNGS